MELDVLYMFAYSGLGDNSDFNTKISGNDIKMIEFTSDSSLPCEYNLTIETEEKAWFLGFRYAVHAS